MSCILLIKELLPILTSTEKRVAEYIIENQVKVTHLSTKELAKNADVSPSAVVRFAYRLNYRGFPGLKIALANDISVEVDEVAFPKLSDKIEDLACNYKNYINNIIDKTALMLNVDTINEAVSKIIKAEQVFFYGVGSDSLLCQEVSLKFKKLNKNVTYYPDQTTQVAFINKITSSDLLFVISYNEKADLDVVINTAINHNACVVVISSVVNSKSFANDSVLFISTPTCTDDLKIDSSYFALRYLINLLEMFLIKESNLLSTEI
ncbi:MAG: MurR/RpiR family transcriptional regulator [Erysipelotrichaceae bacterium]